MSLLRNIPVSVKIFLTPLLLLLFLVIQTGAALLGDQKQLETATSLHDLAVIKVGLTNQIAVVGNRIQSNLFRLTTFGLMKAPAEQTDPIFEALDKDFVAIRKLIERLGIEVKLDEADKAALKDMNALLTGFFTNTENALKVTRKNPSFGAAMVRSAGVDFDRFVALIVDYSTRQQVFFDQQIDQAVEDIEHGRIQFIALFLASVMIALVITVVVGRSISKPIQMVTDIMGRLAAGDQTVAVPQDDRRDALGVMVRSVATFRANLDAIQCRLAEEVQSQAAQRENERNSLVQRVVERFNASVGTAVQALKEAAASLEHNAGDMQGATSRSAQEAASVVDTSESARHDVGEVAAAVEELSSSIGDMHRNIERSAQIITDVRQQMRAAGGTVQGLAVAATEIGTVTDIINKIAGQTNLLALNATIEAARAGEAGKGFAVVATEVKSLANQTMRATADIARQIGTIQSTTDSVVKAIEAITRSVEEVNTIAATISASVEQQGGVAHEIARNAVSVADATAQVSGNIASVSTLIHGVEDSASSVLERAHTVTRTACDLDQSIEHLMHDIRAG